MCSETMMSTFSCWTIMMSSALINILVGPCGSQRYAGESASSILLYCSAPKLVSDTSSPGNTPPRPSCEAQTPLKSRIHLDRSACAAAGAGARASAPMLATARNTITKRLVIANLLNFARTYEFEFMALVTGLKIAAPGSLAFFLAARLFFADAGKYSVSFSVGNHATAKPVVIVFHIFIAVVPGAGSVRHGDGFSRLQVILGPAV